MNTRPFATVLAAGLLAPLTGLVGCANDDVYEPDDTTRAATPARYEEPSPQMQQGWVPGTPAGQQSGEEFIRQAALSHLSEISAGELALQQTASDAVRQFAQRMVQDHTMLQDNVAEVARQQSIGMPLGPSSVEQQTLERLSGLEGDAFDREYMNQQIVAHERSIQLHESYARQSGNQAVQALAQQSLPILRNHLREAQQILSRLGTTPGNMTNQPGGTRLRDTDPQSQPVRLDPSQQTSPQQTAPQRREFISPEPSTSPSPR